MNKNLKDTKNTAKMRPELNEKEFESNRPMATTPNDNNSYNKNASIDLNDSYSKTIGNLNPDPSN